MPTPSGTETRAVSWASLSRPWPEPGFRAGEIPGCGPRSSPQPRGNGPFQRRRLFDRFTGGSIVMCLSRSQLHHPKNWTADGTLPVNPLRKTDHDCCDFQCVDAFFNNEDRMTNYTCKNAHVPNIDGLGNASNFIIPNVDVNSRPKPYIFK